MPTSKTEAKVARIKSAELTDQIQAVIAAFFRKFKFSFLKSPFWFLVKNEIANKKPIVNVALSR